MIRHKKPQSLAQKLNSRFNWFIYFRLHTIHPLSVPVSPETKQALYDYNKAVKVLKKQLLKDKREALAGLAKKKK